MKHCLVMLLCFISLMGKANGQVLPAKQDYSIKIGVEEVRLDAVVVDRKGRQITDLTAGDFEIWQDGNMQTVTSCTYVNE
jgi:hypothetical protein